MRPASLSLCLALVLACQAYQFEEIEPKFIGAKTESYAIPSEKKPPNLMLVVDRSGSMTEAADGSAVGCAQNGEYDSGSQVPCKWNDLKRLLASEGGFLATNAGIVNFGLVRFAGNDFCGEGKVDSYIGKDTEAAQSADAVAKLLNDSKPKGGTPTALSLDHVLDDSRMRTAEDGRDRFVMLLTDGAPNCNPANGSLCTAACQASSASCSQIGQCKPTFPCAATKDTFLGAGCLDENGTVAAVRRLADNGIRTFVIGFGAATKNEGSDAYRVLDAAALAGGLARGAEPRFYQANSEKELSAALAALIEVVRKCDYTLSPPPDDVRLLEVAFVYGDGRQEILKPPAPETPGDWIWDAAESQVTITGARCAEIQSGPEGLAVEFRYVVGL
ncbi:MAG TPA: vWA domain-containing protein [Myxococcales bacterium]